MKENIAGRVARMNLKAGNALYPLFEAVSNSIDAIEVSHAGLSTGRITVELLRETAQDQIDEADRIEPIRSIRVTDNGVGFTSANYQAFDEADTEFKLDIGGKGVGRFTWLKVFTTATIDSTYLSGSKYRKRTFTFSLPDGITDHTDRALKPSENNAIKTTILMDATRVPYQQELRYRASTVASALVRHFLSYLIADSAPHIEVVDSDVTIAVTADEISGRARTHFDVNGQQFTIEHLRISSPDKSQHTACYCARRRTVKEERLKHLPDGRLRDGDDNFYYRAYITSPYLDTVANELRTGFDIDDEQSDLAGVSLNTIRDRVKDASTGYLDAQLSALNTDRDDRVRRVIAERVPELAYVQQESGDELKSSIPLGATDAAVEEAIGAIHLRNQRTGRESMRRLVSDFQSATTLNLATFNDQFSDAIEKISGPSQANLAGYILFRRSIIDIYREILKKADGVFQKEAAIHRLIFPMHAELDTAKQYLDHNLWLLDERLTFAQYVASDRPLSEHRVLFDVNSGDKPDIACYFNLGFSEDDPAGGVLHNVVLVELKRPGPIHASGETPWEQVMRYIEKMREGTWDAGGQKIKASANTRFYCFIVCDLDDPKVQKTLEERWEFEPIFDAEDGFMRYFAKLKAYVELVPLARVYRDAERKHRAFFERLGLLKGN